MLPFSNKPSQSHTLSSGMLLCALLTGDGRAFEAVESMAVSSLDDFFPDKRMFGKYVSRRSGFIDGQTYLGTTMRGHTAPWLCLLNWLQLHHGKNSGQYESSGTWDQASKSKLPQSTRSEISKAALAFFQTIKKAQITSGEDSGLFSTSIAWDWGTNSTAIRGVYGYDHSLTAALYGFHAWVCTSLAVQEVDEAQAIILCDDWMQMIVSLADRSNLFAQKVTVEAGKYLLPQATAATMTGDPKYFSIITKIATETKLPLTYSSLYWYIQQMPFFTESLLNISQEWRNEEENKNSSDFEEAAWIGLYPDILKDSDITPLEALLKDRMGKLSYVFNEANGQQPFEIIFRARFNTKYYGVSFQATLTGPGAEDTLWCQNYVTCNNKTAPCVVPEEVEKNCKINSSRVQYSCQLATPLMQGGGYRWPGELCRYITSPFSIFFT